MNWGFSDIAFFFLQAVITFVAIVPSTLRRWDIGEAIREALRRARLDQQQGAGYYGVAEGNFSRVLAGDGPEHLSGDRLTRVPDLFWLHLCVVVPERLGYLESAETRAVHTIRRVQRIAKAQTRRDHKGGQRAQVA